MIAVRWSEYEKYGCVNCGSDYCYSDCINGHSVSVICGECKTKFVVNDDDFNYSLIGFKNFSGGFIIDENKAYEKNDFLALFFMQCIFSKNNIFDLLSKLLTKYPDIEKKLEKGLVIKSKDGFFYPITLSHPRNGILKHKYVNLDVRPRNGIGEFCTPRNLDKVLSCFVKSKESGQRIVEMFNNICNQYGNKYFVCWLDYSEFKPNWIQVNIAYSDMDKVKLLIKMISENNNIISEEIIRYVIMYDNNKKLIKILK